MAGPVSRSVIETGDQSNAHGNNAEPDEDRARPNGKRTYAERKGKKPDYKAWLDYQFEQGRKSYARKVALARKSIMAYFVERQKAEQHEVDLALTFASK